ncbi:MAG: GNAT family protein [Patescibacteria group bacterium]|nr:GNAT family protein [Patescibacteria group bacterium]MDD4304859.1 GNAT family protein [Patescibacteria group bacterium]MDD4695841.1 GNAT family protein [Patescibacteria group bacterium]
MITIRSHQKTDIPFRVKWLNNVDANIFIGRELNKKTTLKKEKEWFDNYKKDKNKKFFTILDNKKPIGFMGLSNINKINKNCDLFIMIGEDDYRGKGIGKIVMDWLINYGFNKLKLHKINLGVVRENKFAIKLYKKLGFKIEGKMIEEMMYKNKYHDFYLMALFKKDYKYKN